MLGRTASPLALGRAAPEARFRLSDPDAYIELAESVKVTATTYPCPRPPQIA